MHPNNKLALHYRTGRRSFALVATLALIAVATILLVLFVTASSLDRTASYSYSQSVRADQIGLGGLHLVVGQLQAEMSKDALPDTNYTTAATYYAPIFTNVTSANIGPQANVTNVFLPTLVKMSTNGVPFYSGTQSGTPTLGGLQASAISTTTPSINGRSVSTNIWSSAYFGQFPDKPSAPYWVLMTRGGPSSGAALTFGATGNTVNNGTPGNGNYVLGRIAYAVYDEGGLLDATAAGYDSTVFASNESAISQIKGTLAGADLSQITGITSPSQFVQWRNAATEASTNSYIAYITNFASTNGFRQVYQGDSTFIGRQDLIKAALNQNEGFTTNALPYLTTFTRELNAPSWGPSVAYVPSATKYKYTANALNTTAAPFSYSATIPGKPNPNPFLPLVRYTKQGTLTAYRSDGTSYTYPVNIGDLVVSQRFPLDRLSWIGPNGPNMPGVSATQAAAAIRACFGLVWGPAENLSGDGNWTIDGTVSGTGIKVWKYYGSSLSPARTTELNPSGTVVDPISTLTDVGGETNVRAPNFFELLHAGILAGSLGVNFAGSTQLQSMTSTAQNVTPLQLFRIGASMISQVQTQAYPINVEYNAGGGSYVASGAANLPYINVLKFVGGQSPDDPDQNVPTTTKIKRLGIYGVVGLWNPHQRSANDVTRPLVRLYIQGQLNACSAWSSGANASYTTALIAGPQPAYGSTTIITPTSPRWILLNNSSTSGSGGFQNPYGITSADVQGTDGTSVNSGAAAGWTTTPSTMVASGDVDQGVTYEAFRLPDLYVNLGLTTTAIPGYGGAGSNDPSYQPSKILVCLGGPTAATAAANPFQMILKYKDADGNWVPYDYFDGINSTGTWLGSYTMVATKMTVSFPGTGNTSPVNSPYTMATLQATLHPTDSAVHGSGGMLNGDPRSLKFGPIPLISDAPSAAQPNPGYGLVNDVLVDSIWSGYNTAHTSQPKVLSPFDLSGYGGAGNSSPAAPGIPTEFGTMAGFMANWFFPAYLCRNNTAYPNVVGGSTAATGPGSFFTAYQDTDGIQRIADSGLFSTPTTTSAFNGTTGNPYYDPNDSPNTAAPRTSDRPIVLNRPFASVGELGYVFRDDPWRSLDFFSVFTIAGSTVSTSGDSGLLDLFTVTDSVNPVVAGRLSLNTKNSLVLQAVLNNTLADPVGGTQTVSSTALAAIPAALVSLTQTQATPTPLVNKDQLVTKFNPFLPSADFGSTDEQNVKAYREASIRALADVGQTRTWNLMIDLIAQSGKYPPTATGLDQFEVDGERHYWLHIAIDRFTGAIVDRQLELIGP